MKTAMQELIEYIEMNPIVFNKELLLKLKELTFKEKEQIVNAYEDGYVACDLDEALEINKTMFSGDRYYSNTYNQNK